MENLTEENKIKNYKGNLPPKFYGQPTPGRPKGRRNFMTDFREAWKIVAQQLRLNEDPDEGVKQILITGIKKVMRGNPVFFKEFMDRFYGKIADELVVSPDFQSLEAEEIDEKIQELENKIKQLESGKNEQ